jgi:hypothetical protein
MGSEVGLMQFTRNALSVMTGGIAAVAGVILLVAFLPSAALAAQAPVIGSTVAYGVTQSDATLEAWIDPGELPEGAYYQFQVVANTSEYPPEVLCPEHGVPLSKPDGCGGPDSGPITPDALPIGFIEKDPQSRYVRIDLDAAGMTLKPGTTYHYRVLAVKRRQSEDTLNWEGPPTVGPDQTFTTLTPGTPPAIESESTSNITSTDATLEAKINPEGLATTYEFYLEAPSCANDHQFGACEASGGIPIAKGSIPVGSAGQTVSVDVAATGHSLTPGTIEGYRVIASNSAGTSYGGEKTFTTLTAPGGAPVIESVSLSHLSSTDATLEATIDAEGLETEYAFHLISSPCSKKGFGCELIVPIKLPCCGKLFGSSVPQTVSLDLNSAGVELGEGEYVFGVSAWNEGGKTSASGGVFEAPEEGVFEPLGASSSTTQLGGAPSNGAQGGGSQTSAGQLAGAGAPSSPASDLKQPATVRMGKGGKHKARKHKKPGKHASARTGKRKRHKA